MDCVTPQLFSLRLGLWPSESGTSEIVAKWGQNILATFSNERAMKLSHQTNQNQDKDPSIAMMIAIDSEYNNWP